VVWDAALVLVDEAGEGAEGDGADLLTVLIDAGREIAVEHTGRRDGEVAWDAQAEFGEEGAESGDGSDHGVGLFAREPVAEDDGGVGGEFLATG
jgi:hypothetical protein